MAKITMTIEDFEDGSGKVRVVSNPSFEQMAMMDASGEKLTAAHGYALKAINAIKTAASSKSSIIRPAIPRIGRS